MSPANRLAAALLGLLLASCVHGHGCSTCGSNVIHEAEVNDSAHQANWIGTLAPGESVRIDGHISDWGPDLFDGFAFVTAAPMAIEVRLWAVNPYADIDLCVWDPVFGKFVTCFESSANPEGGQFVILQGGKEFHLVVRSYFGSSSYELEVFGLGAFYGPQALSQEGARRDGSEHAWDGYAAAQASAEAPREHPQGVMLSFDSRGDLIEARPLQVRAVAQR